MWRFLKSFCWHWWSVTKTNRVATADGFVWFTYSAKCLKCGRLWESPNDPNRSYGSDVHPGY